MLEHLTSRVRALVDDRDAFGFELKIVVDGQGCIFVDGSRQPIYVSNEDKAADTVIRTNDEVLAALLDQRLEPLNAYMLGKLRIDGDLGMAMKLGGLFRP